MLHWNRVRDEYHDYRERIHTKNYQKHMTAEIHTIAVRKIFAINPSIIREKVDLSSTVGSKGYAYPTLSS